MYVNFANKLSLFKSIKFTIYQKNNESIGFLEIYPRRHNEITTLWFKFNFDTYDVFGTRLKSNFSIPVINIAEKELSLIKIKELLMELMAKAEFSLGAYIIGSKNFEKKQITLEKAKISLDIIK